MILHMKQIIISLVYQEGKKPKMTVSTPEWTDNYYDRTVLPSLGEANVRMQGAETFDAEEDEWVGGDNGEQIYWSHPSGYPK